MTIHFDHKVGDGIHYITDNPRTFPDGTKQLGDTSELCAILNMETIVAFYDFPSIPDIWNDFYPNDIMSEHDFSYMLWSGLDFCTEFDPASEDNITSVLDDLRAAGLSDLADYYKKKLDEL